MKYEVCGVHIEVSGGLKLATKKVCHRMRPETSSDGRQSDAPPLRFSIRTPTAPLHYAETSWGTFAAIQGSCRLRIRL